MSISALLASHSAELGDLTQEQIERFSRHWDLLLSWNRKINLTRIVDPEEAVLRHFGESIFLARHLTAGKIADIGSGAGFPGIPAAIIRPDCQVDLVESVLKKAAFLHEASRGLPNARVTAQRAQQIKNSYDWVISRAVDPREVLALRIAPKTALLVSRADAERLAEAKTIHPLPWDRNRVLVVCFT